MKNNKKEFIVFLLMIVIILSFTILVSCSNEDRRVDFVVEGDVYHTLNLSDDAKIEKPEDPKKNGYIFDGWYDCEGVRLDEFGNIKNSTTLSAKFVAETYSITYILNGGNVSGNPTEYTIESDNITLNNPQKTGYEFLGWSGEDIIGYSQNVTINSGSSGNRTYIANWKARKYTITYDANLGSVAVATKEVEYDATYILEKPERAGYKFLGWHEESVKYNKSGIWKTPNNITLKARWIDNNYNPETNAYDDLVSFTFGEYPQTIKTETGTPSNPNQNGYYKLGNSYYAKVEAKPYTSGYLFSDEKTVIKAGSVYYFKVEPIKWRVLKNTNGTYMAVSDLILDAKCYFNSIGNRSDITDYQNNNSTGVISPSNYQFSDIRAYLNTEFYQKAFTETQKNMILTTIVDNSVTSTGNSSHSYKCENTNDKVFALSNSEATNADYGFDDKTRKAYGSDFAKANGLFVFNNGSSWWLRSPYFYYGDAADESRGVNYGGGIGFYYVNFAHIGVRPALNVSNIIN